MSPCTTRWSPPHRWWLLALAILGGHACAGSDDDAPADRAGDSGTIDASDGASGASGASGNSSGRAGVGGRSAGSGGTASGRAGASGGGAGRAGGGGAAGKGGSGGAGGTGTAVDPELDRTVLVQLIPSAGVSGMQRINFAVPLAPGELDDPVQVRVLRDAQEQPAALRALALHADGSVRSVQIQLELALTGETAIEVQLGEAPTATALSMAPVASTLVAENGEQGPRVWAVLPATRLSASGIAGPLLPEADVASMPAAAWTAQCDYDRWNTDAFMSAGYETDRAVWLFDRGTALYRGYARRGDLATLRSAYVETSLYRNRITGSGSAARNGTPDGGGEDVKYTYAQNLALHYLLSGDDRFRDAAEDMGLALSVLWSDPGYAGSSDFWTERHAGFGLLGFVWGMIASDDHSAELRALADEAVDAYLEMQASYPPGYTDPDARCFAHTGEAHGEGGEYFGCSPWMSAILADALEQYARESEPARAAAVRESLVQLGRIVAERGIQPDGRPYYFMGVGTDENMLDEYDEHIGESAYLIAMAWHFSGSSDDALRAAADTLVERFGAEGSVPHVRSFNWQCRSAVAAPWFLR
ncbi:MAG TPA: hypothetical protein VK509_03075 [Polyangiales bacterium]|nr:hypothetical protein [Polyangiales bacterium]